MAANPGAQSAPNVLPAPPAAAEHHLRTLQAPMREWRVKQHIPPVLLLTGPGGVGKRTMAYFLAQWIFCERAGYSSEGNPRQEQPCGECVQCQRALKNSWVDFTEIRPEGAGEKDGDTGTLKIDQFRRIKESQGFAGHEGGYRIFLIPDADRMTPQAANSVLKLLEEPPKGWIFLLTASDPTLVLPTVLSRCQALKLRPFDGETLRKLLSAAGVLGERQKLATLLSGGSWGRALALATPDTLAQRKLLFDFLERPQGGLNPLLDWAAQSDRDFQLFSDQLELLCLDLVRWSLAPKSAGGAARSHEWENFDGARALANHAENLVREQGTSEQAREFWIARAERIARARKEALTPVNRKLLIQDILAPWLGAVSPGKSA